MELKQFRHSKTGKEIHRPRASPPIQPTSGFIGRHGMKSAEPCRFWTLPRSGHPINTRVETPGGVRSEEHTSELQSHHDLVCRLLLEKKKKIHKKNNIRSKNTPK